MIQCSLSITIHTVGHTLKLYSRKLLGFNIPSDNITVGPIKMINNLNSLHYSFQKLDLFASLAD